MNIKCLLIASLAFLPSSFVLAQDGDLKPCSTEIVNHHDCKIVFDRRYPVTLPTIQMKEGTKIQVEVLNPLDFETLSLDETSATALPGTEQFASLLTAAVPDLKGLVWSSVIIPAPTLIQKSQNNKTQLQSPQLTKVLQDYAVLEPLLQSAQINLKSFLNDSNASCPGPDPGSNSYLKCAIIGIYAQLNQALAPIPKPGSGTGSTNFQPPLDAPNTPNPWIEYPKWRGCILFELAGAFPPKDTDADKGAKTDKTTDAQNDEDTNGPDCSSKPKPTSDVNPAAGYKSVAPDFTNVLGIIGAVQTHLPSTPPAPAPIDPIFDQTTFDALVKVMKADVLKVTDDDEKTLARSYFTNIQAGENHLTSVLAAVANTLTNVQKDFLNYYQNVSLADHALPRPKPKGDSISLSMIGYVNDPQSGHGQNQNVPFRYAKFLGRSVVYSVNAVNNISTAQASITATTARTSIATLTVIYADPKLETSAGALISFVHNRTFANQTITTPAPGSGQVAGEIVIAQTKTEPEVVPFVAAHWRLAPDFSSFLHRRSAVYLTGTLGLNPYSTEPEFGCGLTFSWRSIMISPLYNRAHESVLLPGETVNEVVCNPNSAMGATPPPCTPAPPAPITKTVGENAFAIGLSVRIPTSFTAGTGGVSR